jgi:CRP-like cAMP-binding protein
LTVPPRSVDNHEPKISRAESESCPEERAVTIKLALTSVPVFQFVSPAASAKLGQVAKIVEKDPGGAILLNGEAVPGIYIVGTGKVGVYPPAATKPLAILREGASFGEMSFLEKSKASATIRVEAKGTKLLLLTHADLTALVEGDAELGRALFRGMALTLSQKLRNTNDRITAELKAGRKLIDELSDELSADGMGDLKTLPHDEKLARYVAAISSFVRGVEEFLSEGGS